MKGMLILLALVSVVTAQTETGSVAGTVVDARTLKPVAAALVAAVKQGTPPLGRNTKTGGAGDFQIQTLPAGKYALCVQAGDGYLDPCQWGGTPVAVALDAGQAAAGISVRLATASVVNIDVLDPQDALSQKTKDGRRPDITIGVWGPNGLYHPVRASGRSILMGGPQGARYAHRYQIGVPRDTALRLHLASADVKLGDAAGVALSGNVSQQPFEQVTGDTTSMSFTFTVLGLLP